jgi:hypothetical protein
VPGVALVLPTTAKAWDLRAAWAAGWRVSVTLERGEFQRVEGIVTRVAATDAFARIGGRLVPLDHVLAVHKPSRLGDSTAGARWGGKARLVVPQRERLFS